MTTEDYLVKRARSLGRIFGFEFVTAKIQERPEDKIQYAFPHGGRQVVEVLIPRSMTKMSDAKADITFADMYGRIAKSIYKE